MPLRLSRSQISMPSACARTKAWTGEMKGEAAFYHLAAWKKARFQFKSVPLQEPPTITQSTMMLLMEAMRRLDELESGANRPPVGSP